WAGRLRRHGGVRGWWRRGARLRRDHRTGWRPGRRGRRERAGVGRSVPDCVCHRRSISVTERDCYAKHPKRCHGGKKTVAALAPTTSVSWLGSGGHRAQHLTVDVRRAWSRWAGPTRPSPAVSSRVGATRRPRSDVTRRGVTCRRFAGGRVTYGRVT